MDDMNCADLERLATAASTMGYSSDNIELQPSHISAVGNRGNENPLTTNNSNIITSNVIHYSSDPYDLSRSHASYTTVRASDYHEMPRNDHAIQHHIVHPSLQSRPSSAPQYTVVERSNSYIYAPIRNSNSGFTPTTVSVNAIPAHVISTVSQNTRNIESPSTSMSVNTGGQPTVLAVTSPNNVPSQVVHFLDSGMFVGEQSNTETATVSVSQEEKKPTKKGKTVVKNTKAKPDQNSQEVISKPDINAPPPEPVEIDGRKYFVCSICQQKFGRMYLFKRHQIVHTVEKRGSLSLETKVDIIKRIRQGEKHVALAMEYNVGRSTLSFIMKNAEKFLTVFEKGKFHPETKRLRGAQREDLEDVLAEWLKQSEMLNLPVSGPILCNKAKDFALKLGYKDFKATHGWLDRFKHRKNIVLGRSKNNKEKESMEDYEDMAGEFSGDTIHQLILEYEPPDIFHADEVALLYKVLPNVCTSYKNVICSGGSNSKKRVTVLMCTNMTGSEKFPLLVIGKYSKPKCFKNVKSLPVQYLANEKSWMTLDSFNAWLHDLDTWFVQQNRKVLLIIPTLPVHPRNTKLMSVKVVVCPPNYVGPCKMGITHSLKRNYRRAILESLLQKMESNEIKGKKKANYTLSLNLLSCLHMLAAAWHAITDVTINNSFQRSCLGRYSMWFIPESNIGNENLNLIHKLRSNGYKFPENLTFDDYITFDDDVQVCQMMNDEDIIATVTRVNNLSSDSEDGIEENEDELTPVQKNDNKRCSVKDDDPNIAESCQGSSSNKSQVMDGPPIEEIENSLVILRDHIHFQGGSQEMLRVFSHLEELIRKGNRPNISAYTKNHRYKIKKEIELGNREGIILPETS